MFSSIKNFFKRAYLLKVENDLNKNRKNLTQAESKSN